MLPQTSSSYSCSINISLVGHKLNQHCVGSFIEMSDLGICLDGNQRSCYLDKTKIRKQLRSKVITLINDSFTFQEFICDPPVLTRKSPHTVAMEGQPASLKCKANGDPEPEVHWISPEGRLISNSSRYYLGSLLQYDLQDSTCLSGPINYSVLRNQRQGVH